VNACEAALPGLAAKFAQQAKINTVNISVDYGFTAAPQFSQIQQQGLILERVWKDHLDKLLTKPKEGFVAVWPLFCNPCFHQARIHGRESSCGHDH
jgi:SAM-dependent MidA family methyltransferase